jgi:hypothetical protein
MVAQDEFANEPSTVKRNRAKIAYVDFIRIDIESIGGDCS